MSETATETTIEEILQEHPDKRTQTQEWVDYSARHGLGLSADVILNRVLQGVPPSQTDFTVSSAERRRDAVMGVTTKKLSPVEQKMWQINRDVQLKDYNPPPGDRVDIARWNKDQWAEYGWKEEDKQHAEALLIQSFRFENESAVKLATEALLLAGYSANKVIEAVESHSKTFAEFRPQYNFGYMELFNEVFSDNQYTLPESSLKIVFGQEAFDNDRGSDPQTMEELAWRLAWTGSKGGPSGQWAQMHVDGKPNKHAMFEARMKTKEERKKDIDEKKDYSWGKYYVNENSFVNWFRDEFEVLLDVWGPNQQIQPMDQVKSRISNINTIMMRDMIEKQDAFKSEDKNTEYMQVWLKLQLEAWTFQLLYDNDITYRSSAESLDKWLEQYGRMGFMNPLTIYGFRTNLIQQLLIGPSAYREGRAGVNEGKYLSDNKLGGAFTELVLTYYNLGDFDELQRVLGPKSSFFTREGWEKAMENVAKLQPMRSGGGIKLSPDERDLFDKAFDKDTGKVVTENDKETKERKKAFIDFVNKYGYSNLPGSHLEILIQQAVRDSVEERFDLKGESSGLGLLAAEAWYFNRFMGGLARNDIMMTKYKDKKGKEFWTPNPSVHDKPSELFNMDANRRKYLSMGGGKPAGNPQTVGKIKATAVDPMVGIVTMQDVPIYDESGKKIGSMRKSLLTVLEEAHELRVQQQEDIQRMKKQLRDRHLDEDSDAYKAAQDQIEAEEKRQSKIYMHYVADNANFRENAHREYNQVHLTAAKNLTERIMKGEGLEFEDFTGYDPWGGVTIKRDVLSQKLQKNLLGLARDIIKKYSWMNLNEDVRVPYYNPENGDRGFREGKLAERMFGYDLLNRKEFWMEDEKGRYIKENGLHVIDYNKVDKDRVTLMKQIFMEEIAADMYNHQLINSGDKRYNHVYYINMLDVLKTMPGKLILNEFEKHGIKVSESLFSEEDMKWLKARALNGNVLGIPMGSFGFHAKWVFSGLFDRTDKEGLGFGTFFGTIARAIFSK